MSKAIFGTANNGIIEFQTLDKKNRIHGYAKIDQTSLTEVKK